MSANITSGVSASGSSRLHVGNNINNHYYGDHSRGGDEPLQSQQKTVSSLPSNESGLQLWRAAMARQLPRVKYLIKTGAQLDFRCEGDATAPLHQAVLNGNEDILKALLEGGANVDNEDKTGATPLHLATRKEIVDLLISAGADVDHEDHAGKTPGCRALECKNMAVVSALINAGADRSKIDRMIEDGNHWAKTTASGQGLPSPAHGDYGSNCRLVIGIAIEKSCMEVAYVLTNDESRSACQTELSQIRDNSAANQQGNRASTSHNIQGVFFDNLSSLPSERPDQRMSALMNNMCDSPEDLLLEFIKAIDEQLSTTIASRHPGISIDKLQKDYILSISKHWCKGYEPAAFGIEPSAAPCSVTLITQVEASLLYAVQSESEDWIEMGDIIIACQHFVEQRNVVYCAVSQVINLTPLRLKQYKPVEKCCEAGADHQTVKGSGLFNLFAQKPNRSHWKSAAGAKAWVKTLRAKAWVKTLRTFINAEASSAISQVHGHNPDKVKAIILLGGWRSGWTHEVVAGLQQDYPEARVFKHPSANGPGGHLWKAARGAVALGVARQSQQQ